MSPSGYDRLDEDDVRVRPGRGVQAAHPAASRALSSAVAGCFVTSVDRSRYGCMTDGGLVVAMKARELGRKARRRRRPGRGSSADLRAGEGSLARIVRVEPRATARCAGRPTTTDPVERVIVANADQLAVV